MQKTVIYIDIEDDITAIIGKVKGAKEKIVALVPPKRTGVLQSAVNLQLLARAAKQAEKHLVLISNSPALTGLAAVASIPAAKNLQSKPELAQIPVLDIDDGDDIIDGSQLPVGDFAKTNKITKEIVEKAEEAEETNPTPATKSLIEKKPESSISLAVAPKDGEDLAKARTKNLKKIPNFNTFRKKLLLVGVALLLITGFGYWALVIAPHAKIIITAKTNTLGVSADVTIKEGAALDAANNIIGSTTKILKKTITAEIKATGSKDIGSKASGSVKFSNRSRGAVNIPAGTELSNSGGLIFVTTADVTIPTATVSFDCGSGLICPGTASGTVSAEKAGTNYNAATGNLNGAPGGVTASFADATSGGTSNIVTTIQQKDIDNAMQTLQQPDQNAALQELQGQFGANYRTLKETFTVKTSDAVAEPKAGQEASAGKITQELSYSLGALAQGDMDVLLQSAISKKLDGQKNQKVYDSGTRSLQLAAVIPVEGGYTTSLTTSAKIGPVINNDEVKIQSKAKQLGDIQTNIGAIPGVENVDVQFSPFWVSRVPNDASKITVEFKISNNE